MKRRNPDLLDEIAELKRQLAADRKKMNELLARVAEFRDSERERAREKKFSPAVRADRRRDAAALKRARRTRRRRGNPSVSAEAAAMFEKFTGREAGTVETLHVPDPPVEVVILGELASVSYVTAKEPDGGKRTEYVHRFGRPRPKLLTDAKGKALFVAGGRFRVNSRGIVD